MPRIPSFWSVIPDDEYREREARRLRAQFEANEQPDPLRQWIDRQQQRLEGLATLRTTITESLAQPNPLQRVIDDVQRRLDGLQAVRQTFEEGERQSKQIWDDLFQRLQSPSPSEPPDGEDQMATGAPVPAAGRSVGEELHQLQQEQVQRLARGEPLPPVERLPLQEATTPLATESESSFATPSIPAPSPVESPPWQPPPVAAPVSRMSAPSPSTESVGEELHRLQQDQVQRLATGVPPSAVERLPLQVPSLLAEPAVAPVGEPSPVAAPRAGRQPPTSMQPEVAPPKVAESYPPVGEEWRERERAHIAELATAEEEAAANREMIEGPDFGAVTGLGPATARAAAPLGEAHRLGGEAVAERSVPKGALALWQALGGALEAYPNFVAELDRQNAELVGAPDAMSEITRQLAMQATPWGVATAVGRARAGSVAAETFGAIGPKRLAAIAAAALAGGTYLARERILGAIKEGKPLEQTALAGLAGAMEGADIAGGILEGGSDIARGVAKWAQSAHAQRLATEAYEAVTGEQVPSAAQRLFQNARDLVAPPKVSDEVYQLGAVARQGGPPHFSPAEVTRGNIAGVTGAAAGAAYETPEEQEAGGPGIGTRLGRGVLGFAGAKAVSVAPRVLGEAALGVRPGATLGRVEEALRVGVGTSKQARDFLPEAKQLEALDAWQAKLAKSRTFEATGNLWWEDSSRPGNKIILEQRHRKTGELQYQQFLPSGERVDKPLKGETLGQRQIREQTWHPWQPERVQVKDGEGVVRSPVGSEARPAARTPATPLSERPEPWQQTVDEYGRLRAEASGEGSSELDLDVFLQHRMVVERAIAEGKLVPDEVLDDFPSLRREPKPSPTEPEVQAGPGESELSTVLARRAETAVTGGPPREPGIEDAAYRPEPLRPERALGGAPGEPPPPLLPGEPGMAGAPGALPPPNRAVDDDLARIRRARHLAEQSPAKHEPQTRIERELARFAHKIIRNWADPGVSLKKIGQIVQQVSGQRLPPEMLAYELFRVFPGRGEAAWIRLQEDLFVHTKDLSAAQLESLQDYLEAADNWDVFNATWRRAERRFQAAGRTPEQAIRLAEEVARRRAFTAGVKAHPLPEIQVSLQGQLGGTAAQQVIDTAERVWDYVTTLRATMRDAGLISAETFDLWGRNFRHYNPTRIVKYLWGDGDTPPVVTGRPVFSVADSSIRHLTEEGTKALRMGPLTALVEATFRTEAIARRNRVAQAILWWRELGSSAGPATRTVETGTDLVPRTPITALAPRPETVLQEAGPVGRVGVTTAPSPIQSSAVSDASELRRLIRPHRMGDKLALDEMAFHVFVDGVRQDYVAPKALLPLFAMDGESSRQAMNFAHKLGKALGAPLLRIMAVAYNPRYLLPEFVRSTLEFAFHQDVRDLLTGQSIREIARAYVDVARHVSGKETVVDLSRALRVGLGSSGEYTGRTPQQLLQQALRQARGEGLIRVVRSPRDLWGVTANVLSLPLAGVRGIRETVGMAPKLAEYRHLRQEGVSELEAVVGGRKMNLDPDLMGIYGRVVNQIIPFWSITTQGTYQLAREIRDQPGKAALRLTLGIFAPSIATEAWNNHIDKERYKDIPWYLKDTGLILILPVGEPGKRPYVWIPFPQEYNLARVIYNEAADAVLREYGQTWQDVAKRMLFSVAPRALQTLSPVSGVADWLPPVPDTAIGLKTNRDIFRDVPVETETQRALPPEWREKPGTTVVAKGIGRLTHAAEAATGLPVTVSPLVADYALRATVPAAHTVVGGAANLMASQLGISAPEGVPGTPSILNVPVVGGILSPLLRVQSGAESERLQDQQAVEQQELVRTALEELTDDPDYQELPELEQRRRREQLATYVRRRYQEVVAPAFTPREGKGQVLKYAASDTAAEDLARDRAIKKIAVYRRNPEGPEPTDAEWELAQYPTLNVEWQKREMARLRLQREITKEAFRLFGGRERVGSR